MPKVNLMKEYQILGCKLKALRLQKEIRQKDIADAIGVTQQIVSRWESGEQRIGAIEYQKFLFCCGLKEI